MGLLLLLATSALTMSSTVISTSAAKTEPVEDTRQSADAIVDRMLELDHITYGESEARVTMTLINSREQQQERSLLMMSRRDGDERSVFLRFLGPPDIAGTSFLGLEQDNNRVQYIFMPALGRERRISTSQRNARFVGTDYSFGDMDNRDIENSRRKRLEDDTISGKDCYVVELEPNDDESEYTRIRIWVAKDSFLPLIIRYYDGNDKEIKRFVVQNAGKVENRWVINESRMIDLRRNHSTIMRVSEINFQVDISPEQFTVRALRRE